MLSNNVIEFSETTFYWSYLDNLFNSEELKKIIKYGSSKNLQNTQSLKEKNNNNPQWFKTPYNEENSWFWNKFSDGIEYLNNKYYNYNVWGFDNIQYTEYNKQNRGNYPWHTDMCFGKHTEKQMSLRKLSAVLLLNDDFKGGNFQINDGSFDAEINVPLKAGTLIVFPPFVIHRVTPITEGIRKTLITWCIGPKFK